MKLDLKLYRGYVNEGQLVVSGHLLRSWAPDKYKLDRRSLRHAFSIFHMFRVKPLVDKTVELHFNDLTATTQTQHDGYFRFSVPYNGALTSGWHPCSVAYAQGRIGIVNSGELLKPFPGKLGIISDIDDTFLISHSNSFFKKIYVMLSKNINKRKPFEDVVRHYQFLSRAGRSEGKGFNSFFYVSSSEYNLYGFIAEFAELHHLPKAIIKLKDIKTSLWDFVKTGRGDHQHKLIKIRDILLFYPKLNYVLLGDDTQRDLSIYSEICQMFPEKIQAVYIRQTTKHKKEEAVELLNAIQNAGTATCYFRHSSQAIAHSREIGLIESLKSES